MNTFYLAIAAAYTLYFYWLITTNEQELRHAKELKAGVTVNDYFFNDDHEDTP